MNIEQDCICPIVKQLKSVLDVIFQTDISDSLKIQTIQDLLAEWL